MALAGRVRRLELRFEVGHVVVAVAVARRLAQADAIDDRCVVQRVGNDGVIFVEQRLEQAAVGVEGGGVQNRVLHAQKSRNRPLEFLVHGLGGADEAHRRQAVAVLFGGLDRRLLGLQVARQTEVVVGAHVNQMAAVGAYHVCALARSEHPFRLVQALLAQRLEVLL